MLRVVLAGVLSLASASPVTLVSGLWRVSNKYDRSGETYLAWFNSTLRIRAPMVFFYDDETTLRAAQRAREHVATEWVLLPFEQLKELVAARVRVNGSSQLRVIWLSKMLLLEHATRVANTTWVAWMDAGINVYRNQPHPATPWPAPSALRKLPLRFVYSPVAAGWAGCFAGTAFMAPSDRVSFFAQAFYETARSLEPADDQQVFAHMLTSRPDDFYSVASIQTCQPRARRFFSLLHRRDACPGSCGWACVISVLHDGADAGVCAREDAHQPWM